MLYFWNPLCEAPLNCFEGNDVFNYQYTTIPRVCLGVNTCHTEVDTGPAARQSVLVSKDTSEVSVALSAVVVADAASSSRHFWLSHSLSFLLLLASRPCSASVSAFYQRDAMLARVFAIATCPSVCLSVCPSVTRRYCA